MSKLRTNSGNSTTLRLYLMKEGTTEDKVLRSDVKTTKVNLNDDAQVKGGLYLRDNESHSPDWVAYLKPYVASGSLDSVQNSTLGAVLVLDVDNRFFAVTFGTGHWLVDEKRIERRFGLTVTLGAVDLNEVRELGVKTLRDVTVVTNSQASKGVRINIFGLDAYQDLVKAAAGKAQSPELASKLAGSDGLTISSKARLPDLPAKCRELLSIYHSGACAKRYPFINDLTPIVDDALIERLKQRLTSYVTNKGAIALSIAPPQLIDWEGLAEFHVVSQGGSSYTSQDLEDQETQELMVEICKGDVENAIEKTSIVAIDAAGEKMGQWSLYDCLSAEFDVDKSLYVLNDGDWYEIGKSFLSRVNGRVDSIDSLDPSWLRRESGEKEGDFNARVANEQGYVCFDREPLHASMSTIEFCDLLSPNNEMIHAKMGTSSDLLSHLFNQGLNAAVALVTDSVYRESLQAFLKKKKYPNTKRILDPSMSTQRSIVYAIYTNRPGPWSKRLPFFSRMSLARAADRIGALGFRVALWRISSKEEA